MKRKIALTFLVGAGISLSGCQSPMLGGLPSWKGSSSAAAGSTSPDVGKQKFNGLSQQFAGESAPTTGMGGKRTPPDNAFMASWKKSTAAATAATAAATSKLTGKGTMDSPEEDPIRLDKMPKKISAEVYVGAARLMENQGKFAEAEDKYREALRAAPNDLNALVGLGRLYDRQGQPQKAIEVYQNAVKVHPTSALVFNDLGLCYRRQKQIDKSLVAFRKAVDLVPDNAKYRNNLAAALVDAGRSNEAYQELAAANSAAVAHYNLAFMLQQKGQRADCVRHLQDAVTLDPALTPARDMLAQLGGNAAPQPASEQPVPRPATLVSETPIASRSGGIPDQQGYSPLYTSAPQVEATPAAAPPSYHIGDDATPAAELAQRPTWGSAAWAVPSSATPASQPLPPIE